MLLPSKTQTNQALYERKANCARLSVNYSFYVIIQIAKKGVESKLRS